MAAASIARSNVSTHSRPKAAGQKEPPHDYPSSSFNTQPPEGGWQAVSKLATIAVSSFNTQPPEGGWVALMQD